MNHGEMREQLRLNIDDLQGTRFTSEGCRLILNSAARNVWRKLKARGLVSNIVEASITFTVDVQIIALPAACKYLKDAKYKDTDTTIPVMEEVLAKQSEIPALFVRRTGTTRYLGWYNEYPGSNLVITYTYDSAITEFADPIVDEEAITEIDSAHHDIIVSQATVLALATDLEKRSIWDVIFQDQFDDMCGAIRTPQNAVTDVMGDVDYQG